MASLRSVAAWLCVASALASSDATAQFTAIRLSETPSFALSVRDGVIGGVFTDGAIQPAIWPSAGQPPIGLGFNPEWAGRVSALTHDRQFGAWGGQAAMWSGTPESYTNLNPPGAETSEILAASSTRQGGWTDYPGQERKATIWSGTASSAVLLHPAGAVTSSVEAMTEMRQGGYVAFPGQPGQGSITHAVLWNGTPESLVDLHPAGHSISGIAGMFGDQQVGAVQASTPGSPPRAGMWFGTPESFRSLHPFSDGLSVANATCGSAQVGWMNSVGLGSAGVRAVIWFGTAESVMDLSQFLPPGYGQSIATCVEESNGVFTVGGYVRYGFNDQAFVWVGVPGPGTLVPLAGAGLLLAHPRRR
ncbi:MAG: hypothetical protein KF678_05395 [Phycisphaeraceae bacterium]|nr:hypothetical protein [Phycisphaeraceae bacterium]